MAAKAKTKPKNKAKPKAAPRRVKPLSSPPEDLLAAIKRLAPAAFVGGKLNAQRLAELAGAVDKGEEQGNRYLFDWAGRNDAFRAMHEMPPLTLAPMPKESVNFNGARNLFLEGDNLEVMKLLRRSYAGKVKMIYIDPPYNTGNDFVYRDNFRDPYRAYLQQCGIADGNGKAKSSAAKEEKGLNGNLHSRWLTMMYPRLLVARELMRDDGVIFVSIDDNEVHHLRILMNLVFGEENFVASLVWRKKSGGGMDSEYFAREHEYVLCYRKTESFNLNFRTTEIIPRDFPKKKNGRKCKFVKLEKWGANSYRTDRPTMYYAIKDPDGKDFYPQAPDGKEGNWRTRPLALDKEHIHWEKRAGRWTPYEVEYFDEQDPNKVIKERTIVYDLASTAQAAEEQKAVFGMKILDNSKPLDLLIRLVRITCDEDSLVLDFFAGTGTTAHAVMKANAMDGGNRCFIALQLPEPTPEKSDAYREGYKTVADIAKERIRRAGKQIAKNGDLFSKETDTGFKAFKLVKSALPRYEPPVIDPKDDKVTIKRWRAAMEKFGQAKITADDPSLIAEILLMEGCPLDAKVEKIKCKHLPLYLINAERGGETQRFFVCLAEKVYPDLTWDLKQLTDDDEKKETLVLVCRESAIPDFTTGTNMMTHAIVKTI